MKVRLPDEILFKILRLRLTDNDCRNRGYILDGFPRTYTQAQEVFTFKPKKLDENGEEIAEEEPELEEGEQKSYDGFVPRAEIFPKSVIVLDAKDDQLLLKRIRDNMSEGASFGTHYTSADMLRRVAAYGKANNSKVAEPALRLFFEQQGVKIHEEVDCTGTTSEATQRSFKIYIERFERPFNYMSYDNEIELEHISAERLLQDARTVQLKESFDREEIVEREIRKQKEQYTKHRLEQIKEYERDVLDTKSQPIR